MPALPSRSFREYIGGRFQAIEGEQDHSPLCNGRPPCTLRCRETGNTPPVILRAVWINDLCNKDPTVYTRLHYSDDVPRHTIQVAELRRMADVQGQHPGTWPYMLVEIVYEVVQGSSVVAFPHTRFQVGDLKTPFPPEFLRVANELEVGPERLAEIIRVHADPRVEIALPPP